MPDTASITIVKSFDYRGAREEFSNTYHFEGTTPANDAAWKTLADAIITAEKPTVDNSVQFVRAYGYVAGNENSVAQIDYTVPPNTVAIGTGAFGGTGNEMPGDVAATIRWYTGALSSRGKKIYCRKYMHNVYSGTDQDHLNAAQRTALGVFAAKLIDGTLPGSFKYCGPQGADLSTPEVSQWLTTRTLKRRGKRPPLAAGP